MSSVSKHWRPLLAVIPGDLEWAEELAQRYAEPHRRYHGVAHIDALARVFVEVATGPGWAQPAELALAILFHDAIYEPGRSDNEIRSGELARARLGGRTDIDLERVVALIEATAAHGAAQTDADPDLGHFLDADVSILAAPADAYDRYAKGVWHEYAPVVSEAQYRLGRQAFLQHQLGQATIFHTPWFRARGEAQARSNLARELASLERRPV